MDSTYNLMSQTHNYDTFSIPKTLKTNVQACLEKYTEVVGDFRNLIYIYIYKWRGLIEREGLLKLSALREGAY